MNKFLLFFFLSIATQSVSADANSHNKADSLLANFDYSAAVLYYQQCTSDDDSLRVFRKLALCYRKLGDYKSEISSLLRIVPQDSLQHDDMRQIYYSYSRLQDTISVDIWGKRILKEYPFDGDITASVAADMMQKGDFLSAKTLTRNYLDNDSLNLFVWRQYGYSCYLLGDYETAKNCYIRLYKHGWNNYEVNLILGICCGEMDKRDEAYSYLRAADKLKDGKDFTVLNLLADNSLKLGLAFESATYLEKAISIVQPDSCSMFHLYKKLGETYFETRNYEKACNAFCYASKMNPDHVLTYYNIAQMYNGMKDKENEIKYYRLFLEKSDKLPQNEENQELITNIKSIIDIIDNRNH